MANYDEKLLKETHDMLLEALKFIDAVCTKHDINYMLWAGTCLGAIREHGFIPWDDDADVVMSRVDFEKFNSVVESELALLPEDSHLIYHRKSVKSHRVGYKTDDGRIIDTDIFVADKLPKSPLKQKIIRKRIAMYRFMFKQNRPNLSFAGKFVANTLMTYGKMIGGDKGIVKHYDKFIQKHNKASNKYNRVILGGDLYTDLARKDYLVDWIGDTVKVPFEDTELRVPKLYHDYLTYEYGNYMERPPVEEQVPFHADLD